MRITIVTGPWYSVPPAPCGAVERVWHGLATTFARKGHEVTLLCRAWGDLPREENRDGVRYVRRTQYSMTQRMPVDLGKDFLYALRMWNHVPEGDVLVTNDVWMPLLMSRLPRPRWGRIVQSVQRMPKNQMKFYLRLGRLTAVSHAAAKNILDQCPAAGGLLSVVPNPIDTDIFTPGPDFEKRPRGRTVLYAGRIHPEKGLDLLMRAFAIVSAKLPDAQLRLVGPQRIEDGGGGETFVKSLQNLAGNAPVIFQDPVYGRQALADVYRSADVFVYPSIAEQGETFGVAPLEAMACGLVTVVSDLEPFRDYLSPNENGIVFNHRMPDPVGELAAALERALVDQSLSNILSSAAVLTGRRFGYDAVADLYLDDWAAMLRKEPPPEQVTPKLSKELIDKNLKISIVTGPFFPTPPGLAGAVERRWYHVAKCFQAKGHEVTMLSRRITGLPDDEKIGGIRFIRRGSLRMTQILAIDLIKDFLYTLYIIPKLPSSDILVTNNVWLPIFATRFLHKSGRVVCNIARMPKGQMKYSLRAGRFSAVSLAVAEEIVSQCPSAANLISVIPNPIDTEAFKKCVQVDDILEKSISKPLILYTGRVNAEKGLILLIDAFREIQKHKPDARLLIMGPQAIDQGGGGDEYVKLLKSRGAGLALEIALPIYDRADLARIYQSATVFVYPSVSEFGESFGIAALEAMACGVPTIVSSLACFNEFVTDNVTGLVFDHRAQNASHLLAASIRSLLDSRELQITLGHNAAEEAKKYGYQAVADFYLNDWYDMLAGKTGNFTS